MVVGCTETAILHSILQHSFDEGRWHSTHGQIEAPTSCTERGVTLLTWRAPSAVARDCVAKWARWTAHSTTADSTLPLSISLCAARFGDHEIRRSPATRSHLSMRQGMSANAVRGDTCRAQAMQFSAQRGKWCAIGPWIHARGTAGMPVGCSARGQAQWKAAGDTRGPGLRGFAA